VLEKLSLQMRKGNPVLLYDGEPLARFNKKVLSQLLVDFQPKAQPEASEDTRQPLEGMDLKIAASQLAKAYAKEKKAYYRSRAVKEILPGEKDFKHFIKAAELIQTHGVTYRKFLKAQVEGLGFANDGKGIFPKPNQLHTEQAETRLLEYLRTGVTNTNDDVVRVNISMEDKKTPLSKNTLYQGRLHKVRDGVAKLKEAVYVRELQLLRRKKVSPEVEEYIATLTK